MTDLVPLLRLAALASCVLFAAACTSKSEERRASLQPGAAIGFSEVHKAQGIDFVHTYHRVRSPIQPVAGGVACADYDGDGFLDIYVIGGDGAGNLLYHNEGGKGFKEVGEAAGLRLAGGAWCGATFIDLNGDALPDLFLGGIGDTPPCILRNKGDGTFADATPGSGLDTLKGDSFCAAFGDYDGDGDLDLFITQWFKQRTGAEPSQHLWQNNGRAVFTDVSRAAGITAALAPPSGSYTDLTFTPNFVDVDSDGDLDLLVTGDLGTNRVLINDGGVFRNATTPALVSDHASGAAVGDFDNDLDLDWFVSGISGPGLSGNALYLNDGAGVFSTSAVGGASVLAPDCWGWAASAGDFDNDGFLDIVQVTGYGTSPTSTYGSYFENPARLFVNQRDGTFSEMSTEKGLIDFGLGRGLVVADFDRDGDLDIFIMNVQGEPSLWRNDNGNVQRYLAVKLEYKSGNFQAIGARIKIVAGGRAQIREIRAGCNYVSQNPAEAHFGLGAQQTVEMVEITWPDGSKTTLENVPADQLLTVTHGS